MTALISLEIKAVYISKTITFLRSVQKMEWTREQRYRRIEEVSKEEYDALKQQVSQCCYRQTYHNQPITGLLNDPNGFSYFNGEYHMFYQWFPLGPVHGVKYWYHTTSTDLVHWLERLWDCFRNRSFF